MKKEKAAHEWSLVAAGTEARCVRCGTIVVEVLSLEYHGQPLHPRAKPRKVNARSYRRCRPAGER